MSAVLYLYGFVAAAAPEPDIGGIDDRAIDIVDVGPFSAAVSELDAAEWAEGTLEAKLKDLAWVGRHGARHETVVTWFSDHGAIVPARLLTVFSSLEALRAEAEARAEVIEDLLERFREQREWDLKVAYDPDELVAHLGSYSEDAAREEAEIRSAPPGRRYLLERSHEESSRARAAEVAGELARDLLSRLSPLSSDVAQIELPQLRGEARVVLNAALLVSPDRVPELRRIATEEGDRVKGHGIRVELTGPWAPYRFVPEAADG